MTSLEDKAEQAETEVRLASDAPGVYELNSPELAPADEVSAEGEFPQYGDFLDTTTVVDARTFEEDPDTAWTDEGGQQVYVECPGDLAGTLVETGVEAGDVFAISQVNKSQDGAWKFVVDPAPNPDEYDT